MGSQMNLKLRTPAEWRHYQLDHWAKSLPFFLFLSLFPSLSLPLNLPLFLHEESQTRSWFHSSPAAKSISSKSLRSIFPKTKNDKKCFNFFCRRRHSRILHFVKLDETSNKKKRESGSKSHPLSFYRARVTLSHLTNKGGLLRYQYL